MPCPVEVHVELDGEPLLPPWAPGTELNEAKPSCLTPARPAVGLRLRCCSMMAEK
jgi:hypothetical protein